MSQPEIGKKFIKNRYFEGSRSFKVIHVNISKKLVLRNSLPVLVMISSMSVPICNHSHARSSHSGKITFFKRGHFSFAPLFVGFLLTQQYKISSRKTLGYHAVKNRSFCLTWA